MVNISNMGRAHRGQSGLIHTCRNYLVSTADKNQTKTASMVKVKLAVTERTRIGRNLGSCSHFPCRAELFGCLATSLAEGLLAGATSEQVMKPQEAELVTEISKLQCMVSELKTGFTSALLELSQIQHGDTFLREELEQNRRSCQKKALRLEALVESLREELSVMQRQILQLHSHGQRSQQEVKSTTSKQKERNSDAAEACGGRSQCECSSAPPACLSRGKLLLHCFLQGLKAGLSEGTDARHQVALQLLHSEWEYVSTLNQLYDQYKTPPTHQMAVEPYQTYLRFVEQLLQRHLLFRNTLQERLSAEHWKSLVGDILVQLIGQNDTAFSDMYTGYTTTLASFLSLEFSRLNRPEKGQKAQSGHVDREEMKLLSLLLAPVSRIHSYLNHIQNLLQWTSKEHPDCSLLLGTERALRAILSRCHVILEEDVRWEDAEAAGQSSCSEAAAASTSANCCTRNQQSRSREESNPATHIDEQQTAHLTNGMDVHHSMRLECWSCSPVRRKSSGRDRTSLKQKAVHCGHAYCSLLTPDPAGWAENSDSGQGTFSQPTVKSSNELDAPSGNHDLQDCETDPDDTSAFDYSSVTSCSPDGTLRRDVTGSNSGEDEDEEEEEEEEEEDSQVPVLLKPSYSQKQQQQQSSSSSASRERTVCLRWQIPRLTPHPPLRNTAGSCVDAPKPCLISSHGQRLVSVRKGSPPLHPKSAFRPIWDDPSKQGSQLDSAPEKEKRPGFVPIQAPARQRFQGFNLSRENLRSGLAQQRGSHAAATSGGGLWDDSEDSEGPCSNV
ncbi:rho guanine nucleotide exchange factor 33-like isoform X1 [Solea senegalensis]|uniref:Rho guanine nucleotide exchange factor 33-like isoform X1 n=1 Tax=Solea senegalensis TaxID=28829 RepID=A0AAV6RWI3_SOLSE|nr:rho guanine nucleotide exchange factor 33-like isoform X1 [Solea senegalensis]